MTLDLCIECGKGAKWLRCTQFAGDHPYCEKHAKEQKDFGKSSDGDCTAWVTVAAENKRKREQEKAKKAAPRIRVSKLKFFGTPLIEVPARPGQVSYFASLPDGIVVRIDLHDEGWYAIYGGDGFRVDALAETPEQALTLLEATMWRALDRLAKLRERKS